MLPVDESILKPQQVVIVILVELRIQLGTLVSALRDANRAVSYQVQDGNLHHTLVKVCCPILDNLDSDNFLCLQILALHHLAKGSLAKNIENQIAVPRNLSKLVGLTIEICILMTSLVRAEYIVYIEDIVAILVIEPIVLDSLAGLC